MRPHPQKLRILVVLQAIAILVLLALAVPRYVASAADAHSKAHSAARRTKAAERPVTATPTHATAVPTPLTTPVIATDMSRARVVLWGDSLSVESADYFQQALQRHGVQNVLTRTWGGTAVCDWLPDMRNIATTWHPTLAVVVFNGNTLTPCARRAPQLTEYSQDLDSAISILKSAGVRVVLASTPPGRTTPATPEGLSQIGLLFRDAALRNHLSFVAAGSAVLAAGKYTDYLPCLPHEAACGADGRNQVRAPDGLHFCSRPSQVHWSPICPVYDSGAYRFGSALAEGVIKALAEQT